MNIDEEIQVLEKRYTDFNVIINHSGDIRLVKNGKKYYIFKKFGILVLEQFFNEIYRNGKASYYKAIMDDCFIIIDEFASNKQGFYEWYDITLTKRNRVKKEFYTVSEPQRRCESCKYDKLYKKYKSHLNPKSLTREQLKNYKEKPVWATVVNMFPNLDKYMCGIVSEHEKEEGVINQTIIFEMGWFWLDSIIEPIYDRKP